MDFDELDDIEERQRRALQEIQRVRAEQTRRAVQEQYQQRQRAVKAVKPVQPGPSPRRPDPPEPQDLEPAQPVGLAGFHPLWSLQHQKSALPAKEPEPVERRAPRAPRRRGFQEFQKEKQDKHEEPKQTPPPAPLARQEGGPEEERELQKRWEHQQLSDQTLKVKSARPETEGLEEEDEVPALNAMIAILDRHEEEEQEFERLKPYLPELGRQGTRSIVPMAEDGSNPFVTQAVQVFQQYYPDVDFSCAFGEHYKEVLHAAAHRSARGGHVEQLQLRNLEMAEEEQRRKEERRKLLRDLRQRRYLLQEKQRARGSVGDTKIAKVAPPAMSSQALSFPSAPSSAANGLQFPGMEDDATETEVCFPRATAAVEKKHKPLGLLASLKLELGEDDEPFTLEDLTGLPPRKAATQPRPPTRTLAEEADRQRRAMEQEQRLERLKERRMQKEKAKAWEMKDVGQPFSAYHPRG
ncbi:unnamed protein product [Effrenium voratum]|uniref:Uncharacterized protein n=1 Tax=Effrenium voratum TaxID=2562239 RepID=A0AA36N4F7_9DINO|nr:unnamed protein product [Effrenium voratum]CAJ1389133.1 unnamed protein product [Effrenium voratum]